MDRRKQAAVCGMIVLLLIAAHTSALGADDPNLVGWWTLDEGVGTTTLDSSGHGNDATFRGNPQWVADGKFGSAIQFNGTTDYLAAPDSDSLDIKGDQLTLAAWVRANSWATSHFIRKVADTGTDAIYFIRVQATMLRTDLATSAGTTIVQGTTPVPANEWVHVALVYDGAEARLYLRGAVDGRAAVSGKIAESNNELRIGRGEPAGYFNGMIDDVRVYNRALTDGEIKALDPPKLQAYKPEPAHGDRAVATPLFRWTAGETAVLHNVYLGTTEDLGPADLVSTRQPVAMYWHVAGLEPGVTYYWRVDEIEIDGTTVHTGNVWSFTTQALTAYGPSPADGDASVSPAVTLAWLPGKNALTHRVYFGADRAAVSQGAAAADKGEQKETTLAPAGLEQATTYYWRVDEVLIDGTTQTGPVWSFTTYLSVDDFESYTDDEGSRIYETWIDGWTNKTGSTVGYIQAPFAERTIVHGGKQAMPLDYNNVKSPFYSEAEREFAPVQDLTVNGVNTLVLYVRGKPANGAAKLYLGLEDSTRRTAQVACPDPAVVTTAKWTEWKIPLSDFAGVNAARIRRVYLRAGDAGDAAGGGAGLLYIDDLRAIKTPAATP
jgi:hypothetical protein